MVERLSTNVPCQEGKDHLMRTRFVLCGFVVGVGVAYAAGSAISQDAPPPGMDEQAMAMMKQLQTAHDNPTFPGPFHERLNHFIGRWDVTVRIWPMGPEAPPLESTGRATIEWMLGNRFTLERLDAELDMGGGMKIPLESVGITGYDNYRNQYVGTMCSAMSTELIDFQGAVSLDGTTFDFYGTMHEPMLNVSGRMIRFRTTIKGPDHHVTEVFDLHAGEDHKSLEFVYTRR